MTCRVLHAFVGCRHKTLSCVGSVLQVLGDKSMQIKYLNPNVLFVAAGVPDGSPLLPGLPPPQLRVELLDSVTGRVLASFMHKVSRRSS